MDGKLKLLDPGYHCSDEPISVGRASLAAADGFHLAFAANQANEQMSNPTPAQPATRL